MRTVELALRLRETLLVGAWVQIGGDIVADSTCKRIATLASDILVHVADDPTHRACYAAADGVARRR
jgi:hypothetical protein